VGLVPSPFVFQGEGGGWGCSLGLQVYLLLLNNFELQVYSALLGEGLVPSPFVFQGEGGGWGCSLDLQVYLLLLNDFELQVYSALLGG
jgi:hypothetical protein